MTRRISILVLLLTLCFAISAYAHTEDGEAPAVTTSMTFTFGEAQFDALVALLYAVLSESIIVGFTSEKCPIGWEPYTPAIDRFLVGSGGLYAAGEQGGSVEHSHEGVTESPEGHVHGGDENDTEASEEPHDHELRIEDDHTLPPYIGVLFCKPHLHDHS